MTDDLPMRQWVPLHKVLRSLYPHMGICDGGKFILAHWDCKYVNIRVDMRQGLAYLTPGNARQEPTGDEVPL